VDAARRGDLGGRRRDPGPVQVAAVGALRRDLRAACRARQAGLHLSVRELLSELAGIQETVLLYQGDRGRPRAHRMPTETTTIQDKLTGIFSLGRYAPRR
jgi:hypothetical protein